ncbi:diaminopimelate epimerase [Marinicauda salina]|uniref:Diaminopimelate epimerase n=2 Tax=Marinicauda salina TaxID=2135793 RepID=A0A2U2BWZ9_9PROT|nr:diaminopimelate epimerase [Marinicauda salina]
MNGAGNAFVVIDARDAAAPPALNADLVRAVAAAHPFDQLLVLEPCDAADFRLRVWNRDGGEVGACGNGARAAAALVFGEGGRETLAMASAGGPLAARRLPDGSAEVDLGRPRFGWREIPLAREMDALSLDYAVDLPGGGRLESPGAVSMGNPHVVFFVDDVDAVPVAETGPQVETDALFPERANVGFAEIRARDDIRLRVWERGAGLTLACGTGAAAALVAAHRRGLADREARVEADGGALGVRWDADDHVHLSGPVEFEGEIGLDLVEPRRARGCARLDRVMRLPHFPRP